MKLFAKVFVSIMVGVIIGCIALALDLSDGWVFALYLASALGTAMAVGIFDIEEPKHHRRHMTIEQGLRYRKVA